MSVTPKIRIGFASISRRVLITICFGAFFSVKVGPAFALDVDLLSSVSINGSEISNTQIIANPIVVPETFNIPTITITPPSGGWADQSISVGQLLNSTLIEIGTVNVQVVRSTGNLSLHFDERSSPEFVVGVEGGGLDLSNNQHNQFLSVSGPGRFNLSGNGLFTFSVANTQTGGTGVLEGATAIAAHDNQLGVAKSPIYLDNGKLRLTNEYTTTSMNTFSRAIEVGPLGGVIEAPSGAISFLGESISGSGRLKPTGFSFLMGRNLALNAILESDLAIPMGLSLKGSGELDGSLTVYGTLSPGNSPGTFTVSGNVDQKTGSTIQIEVDGTGTGNGAGNYDRLVLNGGASTYTAGGTLTPILRGISGDATNTYSPTLGQGFQIITAPGGILGDFATLTQPTTGLMPGTQFDTVFGATSLSLYATPTSYSNIGAAGVATNSNRQQIGDVLQPIRPTPGVRETNATRKFLFDSLAPQTTSSLSVAMDQLGGVSYGQIIGMNFENSKFLADQMAGTVALHRRREGGHMTQGDHSQTLDDPQEELWGMAVGRISDWQGDNVGYNTYDVLGGVMAGVQKRFGTQNLAGISFAYAGSSPSISQNMGNGPMQNLQLMAYGSHNHDSGFYVQGLLGGGGGSINATRNITMMNTSYNAQIQTANLAASTLAGWSTNNQIGFRYEGGIGLNYLGMRNFGFTDSGNQSDYTLSTQAGNTQSLVPNLNAAVSLPFRANLIDWRAYGLANIGYETADNRITMQSSFLGNSINVDSGSIGRTRLNLGLGISGQVGRETRVALDVSNQSAQNWNATAANISVRVGF